MRRALLGLALAAALLLGGTSSASASLERGAHSKVTATWTIKRVTLGTVTCTVGQQNPLFQATSPRMVYSTAAVWNCSNLEAVKFIRSAPSWNGVIYDWTVNNWALSGYSTDLHSVDLANDKTTTSTCSGGIVCWYYAAAPVYFYNQCRETSTAYQLLFKAADNHIWATTPIGVFSLGHSIVCN